MYEGSLEANGNIRRADSRGKVSNLHHGKSRSKRSFLQKCFTKLDEQTVSAKT